MDYNIVIDIDDVKHQFVCIPQDAGCSNCSMNYFCNSMEYTNLPGICHALALDATVKV